MNTDTCRTEFFTLRVRGFRFNLQLSSLLQYKTICWICVGWSFVGKLLHSNCVWLRSCISYSAARRVRRHNHRAEHFLSNTVHEDGSLLKPEKHSSWPEMVQGTPFLSDCEGRQLKREVNFVKKPCFFFFHENINRINCEALVSQFWLKRPWKRGFWSTCKRKGKCCLDEEVAVRNIAVTVARRMALWFHFLPVCWALVSFHWAKPHSKNDNIRWQWLNNYEYLRKPSLLIKSGSHLS